MKVILNDFVAHLGSPGDEVDVAPGFARNYLLPKKLAMTADDSNRKTFQNNLKQRARKITNIKAGAEEKKAALQALEPLVFVRRSGEGGRLFGSVTSADIEEALKEKGFAVEKKQIELKQPIKTISDMSVSIKLHQKVTATVTVSVQAEKVEAAQAAEEAVLSVEEAQLAAHAAAAPPKGRDDDDDDDDYDL
jgi:large subunit ribosomal protein L9